MKRYIDGEDRSREHAFPGFPEHLDDYITEDNPVRVIDTFVDEPDLTQQNQVHPESAFVSAFPAKPRRKALIRKR
jgi:hypothetical protein